MRSSSKLLSLPLLAFGASHVLADLAGPRYPAPTDLTSKKSFVADSWSNLTDSLDSIMEEGFPDNLDNPPNALDSRGWLQYVGNLTYSLSMFSLHDDGAGKSLQFHHESDEVKNGKLGTRKVDGDSIYRLQSISKLFTMYGALMTLKKSDWSRPLTDIFPELAKHDAAAEKLPYSYQKWSEVTPFSLASQISGVFPQIPVLQADGLANIKQALAAGLPYFDPTTDPVALKLLENPCYGQGILTNESCTTDAYVQSLKDIPRAHLPWETPEYSNAGFVLFGQVVKNLTGSYYQPWINKKVFSPLGMKDSSAGGVAKNRMGQAVIPDESVLAFVDGSADTNITMPSGGVFSTTNDLAKLGISILNNTLLPANVTRWWMKPQSNTAQLDIQVGAPWEIVRSIDPKSGVVTDIYSKSGDGGFVTTWLMLIPDFGVGFTVLTANPVESTRLRIASALADHMLEKVLPSLWKQSAKEAQKSFGGSYVSTTKGLNSSLTLAVNMTEGAPPGLVVTNFISNSTDVLKVWEGTFSTRLVPTAAEDGTITMRGLTTGDLPKTNVTLFSKMMASDWINSPGMLSGGLPENMYVFEVDDKGKATAVTLPGYRVKLERK
ncbi:hypothetical protein ACHAPJ_003827 [Fusarium lateritium]